MSGVGFDCGTMWLCKSEIDDIVGGANFTVERNAFLQVSSNEDTADTLKENNWSYAKYNDNYYVLGDDALKLKNMLTINMQGDNQNIIVQQVGVLRRPMKDGILNTGAEKLSVAIIQKLIANLLGKPKKENEVLCFCAPGDPVDSNLSVIFHKTMLTNFLTSLGYAVECIPEALAIIFSERPVAIDPEEGEVPFSGISFSYGSGLCNVCFAFKKLPLISFSITKSGDFIDIEAAKVAGVDVSAITRFKESKLDLNNIDPSDMREAALDIFYQNMIEHSLTHFAEKFNQLDNQIDMPLPIVIAGGTASVPGFQKLFEKILKKQKLPFNVKSVTLAENPLYTVANGCLVKALAVEGKKKAAPKKKKEKSTE
ncbi:hypothetical protein LCGC14_1659570 [marine sediment metagenome]|uniref:SHS2 domain-containing protein n=1 Tax=marine sediment metagenome TaxID=412755 RepID=A0A0F9HV95_9ZZZZ